MKIAVASQNRRTITEHAGRCRKFWIYEIDQNVTQQKDLLELPKAQSFHESSPHESHPLDDIQVFIAGGMGPGLRNRLAAKGIQGIITTETDPDKAVKDYLEGTLVITSLESHTHGEGHAGGEHHCGCGG